MKSRGGAEESRREEQKREEEKREEQKRDDQRRESLRRKDPGARKGRKVAKHCVFPMICGSGGRLAKAAGAEPAGQMRDEKLRREAHFQVKMHKFTPGSDHCWKLRCRKSARCCGAKHISKSPDAQSTPGSRAPPPPPPRQLQLHYITRCTN